MNAVDREPMQAEPLPSGREILRGDPEAGADLVWFELVVIHRVARIM